MRSARLPHVLRGAYGRGVARAPVMIPRSGLEMVPLRPSREVVAAVSPLYLAASIPVCLLFLLSVLVVYTEAPAPSPIVVTEFTPVSAPKPELPEVIVEPEPPAPATARVAKAAEPAPKVEPEAVAILDSPPAARPIEIEIDAVDAMTPLEATPGLRSETTRIAAIKVGTDRARPEIAPAPAALATSLVRATEVPLPRASAALPHVSLAAPDAPVDGAAPLAAAPADYDAGIEPAAAPGVVELPEAEALERGGLGFSAPGGGTPGPARSTLAGVPLEALAPCESLAREDELKQTLLREVRTGHECAGSDGSYRFIETRNVNAFSMGVREGQSRALGNRCEELERAIACVALQRQGRTEP